MLVLKNNVKGRLNKQCNSEFIQLYANIESILDIPVQLRIKRKAIILSCDVCA